MKKSILTLAMLALIPAATSFAAGASPCGKIQIEGSYSAINPDARELMYEGFRYRPNSLVAQKTADGYEFAAIETTITNRLGDKVGTFGTLTLQSDSSSAYCVATFTQSQGSETYRIAMAPNGDLILSQLNAVASDGSVVPAVILYKVAR